MTKIPPKPKKKEQNNPKTYKMTKIPPKTKKLPKYLQNLKITKIPPKHKK